MLRVMSPPNRTDLVTRHPELLRPDPTRVITRPFVPGEEGPDARSRTAGLVGRVLALPDDVVVTMLDQIMTDFATRHRDLSGVLDRQAALLSQQVVDPSTLSPRRRLLLGAYFTHEYAVEAAALCNPSLVAHPDQHGLAPGQRRMAVTLRAVGEGHLSSIEFATGIIGPGARVAWDPRTTPLVTATPVGTGESATAPYTVDFDADTALSQRVLWPAVGAESHGMEDARFVRFTGDDGDVGYLATYTAYDGRSIAPRLLESPDLQSFRASALTGPAARNKGMALFPRPVRGRRRALCRGDGETLGVATSVDGRSWAGEVRVHAPDEAWELLQVGNCGSPLETADGWLVLTHGVGPLRTYAIGALLLDLDDPTRVVATLPGPLLSPDASERDGYVPNVLYSCGAMIHDGLLWLPYGISDARIGIASVPVDALLAQLVAV